MTSVIPWAYISLMAEKSEAVDPSTEAAARRSEIQVLTASLFKDGFGDWIACAAEARRRVDAR